MITGRLQKAVTPRDPSIQFLSLFCFTSLDLAGRARKKVSWASSCKKAVDRVFCFMFEKLNGHEKAFCFHTDTLCLSQLRLAAAKTQTYLIIRTRALITSSPSVLCFESRDRRVNFYSRKLLHVKLIHELSLQWATRRDKVTKAMSAIRHRPLVPGQGGDSDENFSDDESTPLTHDIYGGR